MNVIYKSVYRKIADAIRDSHKDQREIEKIQITRAEYYSLKWETPYFAGCAGYADNETHFMFLGTHIEVLP